MRGLERAREDVDAGRLWKARDRLQGSLDADPASQDVLALLGEVCFQIRDLPAAGLYGSLTERDLPAEWEVPATIAVLFFTLGIWIMGWIFLFTRVL